MPLPVLKNLNSNAAAAVTPKVTIWNGDAGDGDYTNDANYTNNAPAEGSTVYVANSSESISSNLNQISVSLKEFRVAPSYTGSIGTSTSPIRLQAERLVIDSAAAQINVLGTFREIHVLRANNSLQVGGSGSIKLDRIVVHGGAAKIQLKDGQCNRLIVGKGQSEVAAPSGMTNDNPLAAVTGFDEIRCGRGSKVVSQSGVNDLNASGRVEITGSGNVHDARLLEGAEVKTSTTGRIAGRLTMFGGTLDVRNPSEGDEFRIANADLYGGEIYTYLSEQNLTFDNDASILGPVFFSMKSGTEIDIA